MGKLRSVLERNFGTNPDRAIQPYEQDGRLNADPVRLAQVSQRAIDGFVNTDRTQEAQVISRGDVYQIPVGDETPASVDVEVHTDKAA